MNQAMTLSTIGAVPLQTLKPGQRFLLCRNGKSYRVSHEQRKDKRTIQIVNPSGQLLALDGQCLAQEEEA